MIDGSRTWLGARYRSLEGRAGRWATPVWLLIGIVGLVVLASLTGFALTWVADGNFGTGLSGWVTERRSDGLTTFFQVVTDVGDSITLVTLAVAVGLAWRARRGSWDGLEVLLGAYLGGFVIYTAVKRIVGQARPGDGLALIDAPGLSFPSGHTTGSAAVYTALVLLVVALVRREAARWAIVASAGLLVLLIAASRVYLGAHWLADVVVGLAVGVTWGVWVTIPLAVRRRERGAPVMEEEAVTGPADASV